MGQEISRRTFLRGGIAAAAGLAAGSIPGASAAAAPQEETQLAALLDISKCIGCEACVEACNETNAHKYPNPQKPFPKMYPDRVPVEDWSEKQDVTERLTPYNWLYIQHATAEINGEETEITIPRRCMHCVNPPCVKLCPWGAAQQLDNGISRIDSDICLGGSKCKKVCPWDIPQRQTGTGLYLDILPSFAGNGVMYKCDRCYNRIAEGELPACIEACPFTPARVLFNFEEGYAQKCDLCAETPFWKQQGGPGGKQACVEVCPVRAIKFTDKVPLQRGDSGYDVNLRNENWKKLGFPIT